jgi:hypothetical protein
MFKRKHEEAVEPALECVLCCEKLLDPVTLYVVRAHV